MTGSLSGAGLEAARQAHARHQWADARAGFLAARAVEELAVEDLSALADAVWWEGDIDEALAVMEAAYRSHLAAPEPDPPAAAMLALDIAFSWFLRGEEAMGSGWMSRAQRLLEDEPPCVEHGYLQSVGIEEALVRGDYAAAIGVARSVAAVAAEHGDETLEALALVGEGIARVKQGSIGAGLAVLDEAMLPVVAGRVRPTFAGNIYCQLMSICHELADLRRAQHWTDATARWCEGFGSAVMFMGVCRVHRAQLLQVRGEWAAAEAEVQRVCEDLAAMNVVAVGMALYELGEVRRGRGDLTGAEAAYAQAHQHGCDSQPGLALVRLAQGRVAEALGALQAAESATAERLARTRIWVALAEVAVAAGALEEAERAADELDGAAAAFASPGLAAAAAVAHGRVRLAGGDGAGAVEALEAGRRQWQSLGARPLVAQIRLLLAAAHDHLGTPRRAEQERSTATAELAELGAAPPGATGGQARPGGLTVREVEVLGLVARGLSNREVAALLVLSERTVARHLANVFTKLGVTSRTAAAAFAHDHGLVPPSA